MKHFLFIILSIVFLSAKAFASTDSAAVTDSVAVNCAAARIANLLRPRLVPLDRETMTFHYAYRQETPKISRSAQLADWAGWMADQFSNVDAVSDDLEGAGFYVATDPASSRSYGGANPLLFATPIRKGAIILDMVGDRDGDLTAVAELNQLSSDLQCGPPGNSDPVQNMGNATIAFRNSKNEVCRAVIIEAYRELGVEAILYSYESDNFTQSCRERSDAFNIINKSAIAIEGNALYWNEGSFSSKTLARMISQTFRDAHSEFYARYATVLYPDNYQLPGSLRDLQTFERSAQSWRKRNLLRCGPKWSIENAEGSLSKLTKIIKSTFATPDVQDATLNWQSAYRQRYQRLDYDPGAPQRILEVERLVYLQTSLARDFSQFDIWREANDSYGYFSKKTELEKDQDAGKILGETVPGASVSNISQDILNQIHAIYNPKFPQPGLYGTLLKKLGFGPLISLIKLNQAMSFLGGPPMLATEVPSHPEVNEQYLVDENKAVYIAILTKCSAMMKDQSLSITEIDTSVCGVRPQKRTPVN